MSRAYYPLVHSNTSGNDESMTHVTGTGQKPRADIAADPRTRLLAQQDRRAQYDRDGVVLVPGLFTGGEISQIRDTFTTAVEQDAGLGFDDQVDETDILKRYPRFVHPHRHREHVVGDLARRHLLDPRLGDIVEQLIGPWWGAQSMFYFKPPGARGQALHQDETALRTHPETCVAAWIAIDRCDDANGSLTVVPGSHREDLLCTSPADPDDSFSGRGITLPAGAERVSTVMEPGDVLFFHGHLVHGSHRNLTADRFRRSLIFHYVPQSSQRVARFYDPLVAPDGRPVTIDGAANGGPCGWEWQSVPDTTGA